MQIENIDIRLLSEYENNAKEHPDWQVDQIARSIQEFGFNDPIAINSDYRIIEGHGRYMASLKLGMDKLPCIVLDNMSEEQERAYIIAHNKLTLNSDFDLDKLEYELNALKVEDFDISLTGFTEEEIQMLENLGEEMDTIAVDDDEDERERETGFICPCCQHKDKKTAFLEVDLNG